MKVDKTKLKSHIYLVILLVAFVILWQFLVIKRIDQSNVFQFT